MKTHIMDALTKPIHDVMARHENLHVAVRAFDDGVSNAGLHSLVDVRNLAEHPMTPKPVLHFLARSSFFTIRSRVAANENTEPHTLTQLSRDPNSFVKQTLVRNPNVPIDALEHIATNRNEDGEVRRQATVNMEKRGHRHE